MIHDEKVFNGMSRNFDITNHVPTDRAFMGVFWIDGRIYIGSAT